MKAELTLQDFSIPLMALKELLAAARLSLNYRKNEEEWELPRGVLGFSAAVLLLCFVDGVGNLFVDKPAGKQKYDTSRNFNILKDVNYFSPPLSDLEKDKVYKIFRTYIVHQSSLAGGTAIEFNPRQLKMIYKSQENPDEWCLNLAALYQACLNFYKQNENQIRKKTLKTI